jgi:hypothetical protein
MLWDVRDMLGGASLVCAWGVAVAGLEGGLGVMGRGLRAALAEL